jgi:two-component system NtrC family sensor kinase
MVDPASPDPERPARRVGLAPKVIGSLTIVIAVIAAVSAWIDLRNQENLLLEEMVRGADQLSNTIVSATWQAMLLDERQAAYEVMQTVGRQEGIEKIRIFNKEGRVMFSTGEDSGMFVDKRAEACDLCHSQEQPLVHVDVPTRSRIFSMLPGRRTLGIITPIYNEAACSRAECHAHPPEINVLGVLDVSMDLAPVDAQRHELRQAALSRAVIEILLMALVIVVLTRRFVGAPIRRLIRATRSIGEGDLDARIHAPRFAGAPDELGELQVAFEEMRARLRDAKAEIERFTRELEDKVEERTAQLESTREQLVRTERLASLGRLAATVAHEINNPIAGILNLSRLMERIIDDHGIPQKRVPDVREYLGQVTHETARIGSIVTDLLSFARQSRPTIGPVDLADLVRRSVSIVTPKLRMRDIRLEVSAAPGLAPVSCDAQQIEQVLINLVVNAAEASPDGAMVAVRIGPAKGGAFIEIEDHGSGISPEEIGRIFEPFFTTKDDGKGVGLGLAVAYGIIEAHGGTIDVRSAVGKGTTFRVVLPTERPRPAKPGQDEGRDEAMT